VCIPASHLFAFLSSSSLGFVYFENYFLYMLPGSPGCRPGYGDLSSFTVSFSLSLEVFVFVFDLFI